MLKEINVNFELIALEPSDLACRLAKRLNKQLHEAHITRFADGEIKIAVPTDIQLSGKRVYVIHATCPPVHERIIQSLLVAIELRNANVAEMVAVVPYFGYARHDKSHAPGGKAPVTAITQAFEGAGYSKIITVELHAPHIIDQCKVPFINIELSQMLAQHIKENDGVADICLVAPDKGAAHRVEAIAQTLNLPALYFTKERVGPDRLRIIGHHGASSAKKAIIIDDMIDSGSTAIAVCNELKAMGFAKIVGYFIHPVFSENAVEKIEQSPFDTIFVSNSIDIKNMSSKIQQFDISLQVANQLT